MIKQEWLTYGLIIQVTILSWLLLKSETRRAYLEGQQAGITVTVTESDGLYGEPYKSSKDLTKKKTPVH